MLGYITEFNKGQKAFLLTKFFYYLQHGFIKFLINIYFWRITNDILFLVIYNGILELTRLIVYLICGKTIKEKDRFMPLRAGLILQLLFFLLIILLKDSIVEYIVPVAIVGGLAGGAYWSSDNLLKFDLTNPQNRLKFTASFRILKKISYSVIPLIASLLVIVNGEIFSSYSRIFIGAILFTVLAFVSTFFISKHDHFKSKKYHFFSSAKEMLKDKNIRIACISNLLYQVGNILPILIGLLLYFSSGTELSIGGYQFVTVLLSVFFYYLIGKYYSKKDYKELLIYGGIFNFLLIFILYIRQDYISIFIYGILKSVFSTSITPFNPLSQDALNIHCKSKKECVDLRVEYIVLREAFVVGGRIIGLGILLLMHYYMTFLVIATVGALLAFFRMTGETYITNIKDGKYVRIDDLN